MALNKKELFNEQDIFLAEMAKSLSHPARIQILRILAEKNTCICGEIVEILPLAQATVSQHLLELKKSGLVKGTIDGTKSCYCINWENFKKMESFLGGFVGNINERKERCC
jgi:DNA-binding transcriptional ArsR family regulator